MRNGDWAGLGPVCCEMTDNLAEKMDKIAVRLAELMRDSNNNSTNSDSTAEDKIDGVLLVLHTLGIPYEVHRQGELDWYTDFTLAGWTYQVENVDAQDKQPEQRPPA